MGRAAALGRRFDAALAEDVPRPDVVARRFARWIALGGLVLVAATWRLWTPQDVFPQVPLIGGLRDVPAACDWGLLAALIGSWSLAAIARRESTRRRTLFVASTALAGLVLLDQHRLQPWAWQLLVLGVVFAVEPPRRAIAGARLLTIAIYAHSAASKCDLGFIDEQGQSLLSGLALAIGVDPAALAPATRRLLAAAMPAGEALVAVLLAVPRGRRIGWPLAIAMHVALLATLGRWGLDHEPGVLVWNVFFVGQALLLFGPLGRWRSGESSESKAVADEDAPRRRFVVGFGRATSCALLTAAVALPATARFGLWDHWPSWAVYASYPERVRIRIGETDAKRLPPEIAQHVEPTDWDGLRRVRIDRWSLSELRAPLYPQDRYSIGVAIALAERFDLTDLHVTIAGPARIGTGERTTRELAGLAALREAAQEFRLNALPRSPFEE